MSVVSQLTVDVDAAARDGLEKMGYTQELSRSRGLLGILFSKSVVCAQMPAGAELRLVQQ